MNDTFKQLVELWMRGRSMGGTTFHYLLLDLAAGKSLDIEPGPMAYIHADHLAQMLSNETGVHIVVELVDDPEFPPGKAVWTNDPWERWKAEHAAINA